MGIAGASGGVLGGLAMRAVPEAAGAGPPGDGDALLTCSRRPVGASRSAVETPDVEAPEAKPRPR
jgi:hypothetical protein